MDSLSDCWPLEDEAEDRGQAPQHQHQPDSDALQSTHGGILDWRQSSFPYITMHFIFGNKGDHHGGRGVRGCVLIRVGDSVLILAIDTEFKNRIPDSAC